MALRDGEAPKNLAVVKVEKVDANRMARVRRSDPRIDSPHTRRFLRSVRQKVAGSTAGGLKATRMLAIYFRKRRRCFLAAVDGTLRW